MFFKCYPYSIGVFLFITKFLLLFFILTNFNKFMFGCMKLFHLSLCKQKQINYETYF